MSSIFSMDPSSMNCYIRSYHYSRLRHHQELQDVIAELNAFLGAKYTFTLSDKKSSNVHKAIADLIDKKLVDDMMSVATDADKARLHSLSVSGAGSWLSIVPNNFYGVRFTPLEWHVALSVHLGAPLFAHDQICKRCNGHCDRFGHHALSCLNQNLVTWRHNVVRDELNRVLKRAGFATEIEQKYGDHRSDPNWERNIVVEGVPGDIKVKDFMDQGQDRDAYLDVVIGNPLCPSHVKKASKERQWLAKEKERVKHVKYNNAPNVLPMAMEATGAIGPEFRRLLAYLASAISRRKSIPYPITMHRIRSRIIALMIRCNTKMVLRSTPL